MAFCCCQIDDQHAEEREENLKSCASVMPPGEPSDPRSSILYCDCTGKDLQDDWRVRLSLLEHRDQDVLVPGLYLGRKHLPTIHFLGLAPYMHRLLNS